MVVLYAFIEEEKHSYLLNKYAGRFNEELNTRIQKYRRWQDAQLSLLGRVLLTYGLKHYFDLHEFEIDRTSDHKPFLVNEDTCFNISHAGNLVICCIDKFPMGIDVEYLDPATNYIDFRSQMTQGEFDRIHHSEDKISSFFTYWVEKEAVIKAHGKGLFIPLQSFEVLNDQTIIEKEKFYLKKMTIHDEYQCCIASGRDIRQQEVYIEKINLAQL